MTAKEALECISEELKKLTPIPFENTQYYQIIEQALTELEELKKSDESKEQSSINYYNEMRKYKKELEEFNKREELLNKIKDILALNYAYQEIGIKIARLFKEEMK